MRLFQNFTNLACRNITCLVSADLPTVVSESFLISFFFFSWLCHFNVSSASNFNRIITLKVSLLFQRASNSIPESLLSVNVRAVENITFTAHNVWLAGSQSQLSFFVSVLFFSLLLVLELKERDFLEVLQNFTNLACRNITCLVSADSSTVVSGSFSNFFFFFFGCTISTFLLLQILSESFR